MTDRGFSSFRELHETLLAQHGNIVHQIWYDFGTGKPMSSVNRERQEKCIRLNKDMFYMCWTNEYGAWLINHLYPWFGHVYYLYPYPIQRVDAIRYFILYTYGGFYVDIDTVCLQPFSHIRQEFVGDLYLSESSNPLSTFKEWKGNKLVTNSFMFSIPRHPFWKAIFDEL